MSSLRPCTAVLLAACASVAASASQDRAPRADQPLTSDTVAVVVDAIVRDEKGNPVTDLRKEDFRLLEDGVEQQLLDATVVAPGKTADASRGGAPRASGSPTPPIAAAGPSFTAIVFNSLTTDSRVRAYSAALGSLKALRPEDFVAVYLADTSLVAIHPYTNDRGRVRRALEEAARRTSGVPSRDLFAEWNQDPAALPVLERTHTTWDSLSAAREGFATTDALLAIVEGLAAAPGRKSIIFFSEGFPLPAAVEPHFRRVVASANRANVSVYTVDAAGLRTVSQQADAARAVNAVGASGIAIDREGGNLNSVGAMEGLAERLHTPSAVLGLLARETGGFLIEDTNDLAAGYRRIDADRRFHYLLTYTPRNSTFDGRWRTITVALPSRKVTVRARSGYLAERRLGVLQLVTALDYERPAIAALERVPVPTDLPVRASTLLFPEPERTRVVVLAAADAATLTFAPEAGAATYSTDFTVLARIRDERGEVVRKGSQLYRLSGPLDRLEEAKRGTILFYRQPTLDAGTYTLELAVHDALAARSGVRRTTVVVPPSSRDALRVSSLVVVDRLERVAAEDRQPGNPLYAGDVLVYPNTGEPLRKSQRQALGFYVVVVPGRAVPQASIEILHGGRTLAQTPVQLPPADAEGRIAHAAQIDLRQLPAATYTLRLTVTAGDQREVRVATFQLQD